MQQYNWHIQFIHAGRIYCSKIKCHACGFGKKKKESYTIFRIKPHSRNTMNMCKWTNQNITGLIFQAHQLIHISKLFHGIPQAESQLSIKQNRFFRFMKQLLVQSSMWVCTTCQLYLRYLLKGHFSGFFSALLQSLHIFIVSSSRCRSEFHLPLLKLNMLLSHTRVPWNKVLIKTSEAGRLHPYSYFTVVTA